MCLGVGVDGGDVVGGGDGGCTLTVTAASVVSESSESSRFGRCGVASISSLGHMRRMLFSVKAIAAIVYFCSYVEMNDDGIIR